MPQPNLARAADSTLVIVDIQERLAAVMAAREAVIAKTALLIEAATRLAVPIVVTEQYPKGLGHTEPQLTAALPAGAKVVEKTAFSACGALELDRPQVIIAGMEAHVCVLQTALELTAAGKQVFVVADAVCSRAESNSQNALARMQQSGVIVTNTESLVFEWLRDASNEHFRPLSKLIR